MNILTEKTKRIHALHQWMISQDIPRAEWGALFAAAAGQELAAIIPNATDPSRKVGLLILTQILEFNA